ncbi:MAG: SAM hydrolase/SAM-dependent halogenase family protein [Desulfotomaculales bacterium]
MIALLTDFGACAYVGMVKGVIFRHHPEARVLDITHNVRPYAVREAAWLLFTAYRYFPEGTVFLAVVDPGVGSERQPLAVATAHYYFVGPDNGLLYPAAEADGIAAVVRIIRPADASRTFEARDVFAPAAAMIDRGTPISSLGTPARPMHELRFHRRDREGEVVYIDRFGNIITNLPPEPGSRSYKVTTASFSATLPHYPTYAAAPPGAVFLVTGSAGTLEISVRNASASEVLSPEPGERICITPCRDKPGEIPNGVTNGRS